MTNRNLKNAGFAFKPSRNQNAVIKHLYLIYNPGISIPHHFLFRWTKTISVIPNVFIPPNGVLLLMQYVQTQKIHLRKGIHLNETIFNQPPGSLMTPIN